MVAGDRRRYRHPGVQLALLGLAGLESAWLARRVMGAGRYRDRTAMWADVVFSSVGLLACEAALGDGDAAPWMKNVAIGAALGAASPSTREEGAAAMVALGSSAVLAGVRARGRDSHVAGLALAVNDAISWTGMFTAARIYVENHRRSARLRDATDAIAVEQAAERASQEERARQHRLLHRGTVDALRTLARSDDPLVAGRVARHEAARLRYALRARGEPPTGVDAALCDVAEAVAETGLTVELVTAELSGSDDPVLAGAIASATFGALLAARELGGAARAVVRAVSEDDRLVVTIRDRGHGFEPGGHSEYEARLRALTTALAPLGGSASFRSSPGEGARVTLEVPSSGVQRGVDDAPDGLPVVARGGGRARDDDGVTEDGHVERRAVGSPLGAAQDEADRARVGDAHARARRQPAQPGFEERDVSEDTRGWGHAPTMARAPFGVVGRTAPFLEDIGLEADRAEQTIRSALFTWRFTGIATGVAAFVAGRRRYRSKALGLAQLGVAIGESAVLARRVSQRGRWEQTEATVDLFTGVAMLLCSRANLARPDRATWLNWAPWSFAASAVTAQAIGVEDLESAARGAVALAGATAVITPAVADVVATTGAMAAFFAGARVFARQIRGSAARLSGAFADAVRAEADLAVERERGAQLRMLHDGALQTLEAVGSGRYGDIRRVRAEAEAEARRLEREIEGLSAPHETFTEGIVGVVREHGRLGLDVDLQCDIVAAPRGDVARALREACNEALTNVRKHAATTHASVHVKRSGRGVEVTVRDRGCGFDPAVVPPGFGRAESLGARLASVGGRAEVSSAPGVGTTVTLWGPE
jgi:signal transduction histidine kinase